MFQSLDSIRTEEARIRAAYAKREEDDPRYSWSSPGYQLMVQQRERRLLALLRRYGFAALECKSIAPYSFISSPPLEFGVGLCRQPYCLSEKPSR